MEPESPPPARSVTLSIARCIEANSELGPTLEAPLDEPAASAPSTFVPGFGRGFGFGASAGCGGTGGGGAARFDEDPLGDSADAVFVLPERPAS